jgi:hypothetical protein
MLTTTTIEAAAVLPIPMKESFRQAIYRITVCRDKRTGRMKRTWHIQSKGYPRFHSGPFRNRYVHRVIIELAIGRPLRKDEDVHHRDDIKRNFRRENLQVVGHEEHGWYSSKQRWFMQQREKTEKEHWDEYFAQ